ncbi:MAG TPA: HAD-IA family hydrolase [Candidatus Babeliales bacterium]|nr:HAD-IA family hydrolase [Candidatus Babeliales bacterium]
MVKTDSLTMCSLTGYSKFIKYIAHHPTELPRISKNLRKRLFGFLNTVIPPQVNEANAKDPYGMQLPQIMCDWLKGTYTSQEICTLLLTQADQSPFFKSQAERSLIRSLIRCMFTPELFIQATELMPDAYRFAQECKRKGHNLYILSNWDSSSFELLHKKYNHFFDLFDGIVISGDIHAIKPSPAAYHHLLTTYNLNPSDCIFIDDRIENRIAAEQCGISCYFKQKRCFLTPWKKVTDFLAIAQYIIFFSFFKTWKQYQP